MICIVAGPVSDQVRHSWTYCQDPFVAAFYHCLGPVFGVSKFVDIRGAPRLIEACPGSGLGQTNCGCLFTAMFLVSF